MKAINKDGFSIVFNHDGYKELSNFILDQNFNKILILTDENTKINCLDIFITNIKSINGKICEVFDSRVLNFSVKSGEHTKNIDTSLKIWEFLMESGFKRSDLIINLGGGMITDLGGFVASTFMRGIKFINVPTSLLAMVDASIGGKTGIDFKEVKNLIGVFEFAKISLIDLRFLKTLSKRQITSGYAEMIKHSLISDNSDWEKIRKIKSVKDISAEMIYESIKIKILIIEKDPFESGVRKYLNYGHTLGHAIESKVLGSEKELLHGESIAIGIILESYISYLKGGLGLELVKNIKTHIKEHFKTTEFVSADISKIIELLKFDKKNRDKEPMFVLLKEIGKPIIDQTVSEQEIREAFNFYKD